MTLELINPKDRPTPDSYTQVVTATGSRLVFVAGQVADDAQGNLVSPGESGAPGPPGVRQRWALPRRRRSRTGRRRRSRSTSFTTRLTTCLISRRRASRYSVTTSPPTPSWELRR